MTSAILVVVHEVVCAGWLRGSGVWLQFQGYMWSDRLRCLFLSLYCSLLYTTWVEVNSPRRALLSVMLFLGEACSVLGS